MITPQNSLDFSAVTIGESREKTITLRNNNTITPLPLLNTIDIAEITITDDGGGAFSIRPDSYPSGLPDQVHPLIARAESSFVVVYSPTINGAHTGELLIRAQDIYGANIENRLLLNGEGTQDQCPTAIAQARVAGTAQWHDALRVTESATVELSSEGSLDPAGGQLTYEWAIIGKPAGSNALLAPSTSAPNPTIKPDLSGSYTVELTTRSDSGLRSCETSTVEIIYEPINEDILIELTWYSDEVPTPDDQTGRGTDLDLFYKQANSSWDGGHVLYWFQTAQNWGDQGVAELLTDSLYGGRPETVAHTNPADGSSYDVGVHYYADNGNGSSYASIRIYLKGALVLERLHQQISDINDFWHPARIQWGPDPEVITPINEWVSGHGHRCATCAWP